MQSPFLAVSAPKLNAYGKIENLQEGDEVSLRQVNKTNKMRVFIKREDRLIPYQLTVYSNPRLFDTQLPAVTIEKNQTELSLDEFKKRYNLFDIAVIVLTSLSIYTLLTGGLVFPLATIALISAYASFMVMFHLTNQGRTNQPKSLLGQVLEYSIFGFLMCLAAVVLIPKMQFDPFFVPLVNAFAAVMTLGPWGIALAVALSILTLPAVTLFIRGIEKACEFLFVKTINFITRNKSGELYPESEVPSLDPPYTMGGEDNDPSGDAYLPSQGGQQSLGDNSSDDASHYGDDDDVVFSTLAFK